MSVSKLTSVFSRFIMNKKTHTLAPNALQIALEHHQAGQLSEAQTCYRQILQIEPNHVDALHFLGVLLSQLGENTEAVKLINQALRINPSSAIYCNLGNILKGLNQPNAVIENYQKSLALDPNNADVHYNLALMLQEQGQSEQALKHYDSTVALRSDYAPAYYNRGIIFKESEELESAIENFQQAIALKPDYADAYNNLGLVFHKKRQWDKAIESYRRALSFEANSALIHNNLGITFQAQNNLTAAVASYRQAITLKPDYGDVYHNLGTAFKGQSNWDAAIESFQQALLFNPEFAETHLSLGDAFRMKGQFDRAIKSYQQALKVKPDFSGARGMLFHTQQHCADWSNHHKTLKKICEELKQAKDGYDPFIMLATTDSTALQLQAAQLYVAKEYPPVTSPVWTGQRYPHKKIRIAYISGDFREHALSYLMAGLFEQHNQQQFETIALSLSPNDKSAMGQRVRAAFTQFIEVFDKNDYEIAQLIRELEIDIAIDLMGFTLKSRTNIFAYRAAPIQINYLGFPGTMGANYIDYIFADAYLIPQQHQKNYAEKIVYLPDCFQANDDKRLISEVKPSRSDVGLPESGFVFCSFNNSYKISPDFFDSWMRLLKAVPKSVLWLIADNAFVKQNFYQQAKKQGIRPERLIFAGRMNYADHLARFSLADVFLDTLPFNAGTTASDALWAGVPVITCSGEAFASRMAGSLLTAIGLPELITPNLKEYQALALKLATTPTLYTKIREKLAKNRLTYPLFDTDRFRSHIEVAYHTMWERYQRGEMPESFSVPPSNKFPNFNEPENVALQPARTPEKIVALNAFSSNSIEVALQHHQAGEFAKAEAIYRQILQSEPQHCDALSFLGVLLSQQGDNEQAIDLIKQAINIKPSDVMYCNLGKVFKELNQTTVAIENYQKALQLNPHNGEVLYNLGVLSQEQNNLAQAMNYYVSALQLNLDNLVRSRVHHNLGNLLNAQSNWNAAIEQYRHALLLNPSFTETRYSLGMALLAVGQFTEGWQLSEARCELPHFTPLPSSIDFPQWRGESLKGKSLLVVYEQGLGDEIQFCRYVSVLKQQGARYITWVCKRPLKTLFLSLKDVDKVVTEDEVATIAAHDYWIFSLSIPLYCQTTLETIPASVPYLYAHPQHVQSIAQELSHLTEFKVGICWKGNPLHKNDQNRTIGLAPFKTLFKLSGIRFFTLQPKTRLEFIAVSGKSGVDIGREINETTFEEATAFIANLDLVISCDSSLAHLAGALGKPVWIALPFVADWRWLTEREDSPWYPTARLFRQTCAGDWEGVFSRIENQLSHLLSPANPIVIDTSFEVSCINPTAAENDYHQGIAFHSEGNLEAAIKCYLLAIAHKPDYAQAHYKLATVYHRQNNVSLAIQCYQTALLYQPHYPEVYNNLGNLFLAENQLDQAIENYQQALLLKPDYVDVYSNLGVAFSEQGKLNEAISCYQKALLMTPDDFEVLSNLGVAFWENGQLDEAIASYHKAILLNPQSADLHYNLANALQTKGELDAAIDYYQKTLLLDSHYTKANYMLSYTLLQCCDWKNYHDNIQRIIRDINAGQYGYTPFSFIAISQSASEQLSCASVFSANKYPPASTPLWQGQPYPHQKIRLAYVSADFREHAVSYLMAGLFEQHDRNQFEVFAISLNPAENTSMGRRVKNAFDQFIEVVDRGDAEIASLIRELEIDIAVDLMGFTLKSRAKIFALRPAPIQINYLGFPATMGANYMDYIFADSYVIPEEYQRYYTEKVVYLPDTFQANDDKRVISEQKKTRMEVGLPETGFVFCAFNNSNKLNPVFFNIWMRLLKSVPDSVLWLVSDNPNVQKNLSHEAVHAGVDAKRLIFASTLVYAEHLARFAHADLFLDVLPFNAGTTASDALWAGVPIVTCSGEAFAARMAGSLLTTIGLSELIAKNLADYEALAFKLATTPAMLAEIKAKLAHNRIHSPLFNTDKFRQHIEMAYMTMWQRYQRGEMPASFSVLSLNQPENNVETESNYSSSTALQTALQYHQIGQLSEAQAVYQQILQNEPNHPDALHFLGILLSQQGNNETAIELISKAVSISPSSAMYCNLGNILKGCHQTEAAIENYQKSLALDSNNADVHYNLGLALQEQGQLDAAIHHYETAQQLRPDYVTAYYNLGIIFKEQQNFDAAIAQFQHALLLKPDYAEAYNNLGLVYTAQNELDLAVEHFQKALAINNLSVDVHNNLGIALQAQEKTQAAIESYLKALEINPDYIQAYCNLGSVYQRQKQLDKAIETYQKGLAFDANYSELYFNLGSAFNEKKELDSAIESYQQALLINPNYAKAYYHLGNLFAERDKLDDAEKSYQQALLIQPNDAETLYKLALLLHKQDKLPQAIDYYKKTLLLIPDWVEAYINLGIALHTQGDFDEAIAHYYQALSFQPDCAEAYHNLASVLKVQHQLEAAIENYQKAIAINPDYAEAKFNLAHLYLLLGRLEEGWPYYEVRYLPEMTKKSSISLPKVTFPQWQGESLLGKSLVVLREQGFGDEIQFSRYLPILKKLGASSITFVCTKELKTLFERIEGVDKVLTVDEALTSQQYDYWTFVLSVPLYCKTRMETIPATVPYLYANPKQQKLIASELAPIKEFKVGICWKGNPKFKNDAQRSPGIIPFKPLFNLSGVKFFTLQPETRTEFLENVGAAAVDRKYEINKESFEEAAALIANLDLVITSCTSICHLVGALGKPLWVVLPFDADWRWFKEREDSPWYPTARLFRQPQPGDWQTVFECVEQELKNYLPH